MQTDSHVDSPVQSELPFEPTSRAAASARLNRWLDRIQRSALAIGVMASVVALLLIAVILVWAYLSDRDRERNAKIVKAVEPAGHLLNVTLSGDWFARALVQTDRGFYGLADGVSLHRDAVLTLETRGNGRRYLCDEQHRCTQLL